MGSPESLQELTSLMHRVVQPHVRPDGLIVDGKEKVLGSVGRGELLVDFLRHKQRNILDPEQPPSFGETNQVILALRLESQVIKLAYARDVFELGEPLRGEVKTLLEETLNSH